MERNEKYYKMYFIVELDDYVPEPIGFHLIELLGYNKDVLVEFYKIKNKYYNFKRIEELGYVLETNKDKKNIHYISFKEPYNRDDIYSIVDEYRGEIYFYWGLGNEFSIKEDRKMEPLKAVEQGLAKFAGAIQGDCLQLYFEPAYYLEHEAEIQQRLEKFKELYRHTFGYDPSRKAEV
jgi:hypothetical protein